MACPILIKDVLTRDWWPYPQQVIYPSLLLLKVQILIAFKCRQFQSSEVSLGEKTKQLLQTSHPNLINALRGSYKISKMCPHLDTFDCELLWKHDLVPKRQTGRRWATLSDLQNNIAECIKTHTMTRISKEEWVHRQMLWGGGGP